MSLQKKIAGLILSHLTWKDIKIYAKPWHDVILPSCCLVNIKNAGAKKFSLCMPSLPAIWQAGCGPEFYQAAFFGRCFIL